MRAAFFMGREGFGKTIFRWHQCPQHEADAQAGRPDRLLLGHSRQLDNWLTQSVPNPQPSFRYVLSNTCSSAKVGKLCHAVKRVHS